MMSTYQQSNAKSQLWNYYTYRTGEPILKPTSWEFACDSSKTFAEHVANFTNHISSDIPNFGN